MEAKTKIIAAVAVIVMCAAGLVGAGYAYTASTQNAGNTASMEYITLVQGGDGAYTFTDAGGAIQWNAADGKVAGQPTTTFTLDGTTQETLGGAAYDLKQVGGSFQIKTAQAGGTVSTGLVCAVTSSVGFKYDANAAIFLKIVPGQNAPVWLKLTNDNTFNSYVAEPAGWTGASQYNVTVSNSNYDIATVTVMVGYLHESGGVKVAHAAGVQPAGPSTWISGASLLFTVNSIPLTAVSIADASVSVGNTVTLTPTFTPTNATNLNAKWISSDTTIATVDEAGVVTGVAAGSVTITVTTLDGGLTDTCTVTVNAVPAQG